MREIQPCSLVHRIYNAPEGTTQGMDYITGPKKRKLDIMLATPAAALALPAIALLGAAVYLQDGSYPFVDVGYENEVTGPVHVPKIRTMIPNAVQHEEQIANGATLNTMKMTGIDPRVTWLGKYIRRSSFDELPQLGAARTGKLSMVGPRHYSRTDWKNYLEPNSGREDVAMLINNYKLGMKNGVTGMYGICGRAALSMENRIFLDNEYAQKANWLADLRIIAWTIPALLRGTGAK